MKWINRYKTLIHQASEGIVIINNNRKIVDANNCAVRMLGSGLKNLKGNFLDDFITNEQGESSSCIKNLIKGQSCLFEGSLLKTDNTRLEVEISAKRFMDGDIITFLRDISERKKVLESMKHHACLLQNLREAVISTDQDFRISMWNKGAEELYGWTEEEVSGRKVTEVLTTGYNSTSAETVEETLLNESRWVGDVVQHTKAGVKKNVFSSIEILRNEKNEITGSIIINIDVTEKLYYESRLQENKQQLKHIAWLQSHQVRAPLTNILGIAQLLNLDDESKETSKQLLGYLMTSAKKLDSVIKEITALAVGSKIGDVENRKFKVGVYAD